MSPPPQDSSSSKVAHDSKLINRICSHASNTDLARCALACKEWGALMTAAMWHTIQDFNQAILALGAMRCKDSVTRFERRPTTEDWIRASRLFEVVRVIHISDASSEPIDAAALETFLACVPTGLHPFPNLISFTCTQADISMLLLEHLPPSMTDFSIRPDPHSLESLRRLRRALPYIAPHLKSLSVETLIHPVQASPELSKLIASFPGLRKVSVPMWSFTADNVAALALLHDLEEIGWSSCDSLKEMADIKDSSILYQGSFSFMPPAFGKLTTLFFTNDVSNTIAVLQSLAASGSPLRTFWVKMPEAPRETNLRTLFDLISASFPLLNAICLYAETVEWGKSLPVPHYPFNIVTPATSLQSLKEFVFNGQMFLDIDEEQLEFLLKAWPKLSHLIINHCFPIVTLPPPQSKISFNIIPKIAKICPDIQNISLYFDTSIDLTDEVSSQPQYLTSLWPGLSPISDPSHVAAVLRRLLPRRPAFRLQTWHYTGRNNGRYQAPWLTEEVMDYLDQIHALWVKVTELYPRTAIF